VPVNLLLCEGGANSPDVRVLRKLLSGYCGEIRPAGSRYGMGDRIQAYREALGQRQVAGILDGDFRKDWTPDRPLQDPLLWQTKDQSIHFGWRWSRKEIENYVIDPLVVSHSLAPVAPPQEEYAARLSEAADRITVYQAARTALSNCRRRFRDLPANWGREQGPGKHPFPHDLSDHGCREGIRATVRSHHSEQAVTPEQVLSRYEELLPQFAAGGVRRSDFLWTFAGKDLLHVMEAGLVRLGFRNAKAFREKVLLGIESTNEDIATWSPEWSALRNAVEAF